MIEPGLYIHCKKGELFRILKCDGYSQGNTVSGEIIWTKLEDFQPFGDFYTNGEDSWWVLPCPEILQIMYRKGNDET